MLLMPAEWEPHEATWLAWPHDPITFPDRVKKVEKIFEEIIAALAPGEAVNLLVRGGKKHSHILKNVRMFETDYADVWTRDYMPSFAIDNAKVKAVKWTYDVYSGKFPDLVKDNMVFQSLAVELGIETIEPGIVLEGGAIEVNGRGTLLTTEQCLLARNVGMTKEQYEKYFRDYLGVTKVVWLPKGMANDHTDGHVDEVARFLAPSKIVCAYEDDPADENYEILRKNYNILQRATDQDGKHFELIKLPMPHMTYDNGRKAPASYANFYIGNAAVLASVFGDKNDEAAVRIIQSQFPDRKVVPVDCRDLIYGGGGIHCVTREQPMI